MFWKVIFIYTATHRALGKDVFLACPVLQFEIDILYTESFQFMQNIFRLSSGLEDKFLSEWQTKIGR